MNESIFDVGHQDILSLQSAVAKLTECMMSLDMRLQQLEKEHREEIASLRRDFDDNRSKLWNHSLTLDTLCCLATKNNNRLKTSLPLERSSIKLVNSPVKLDYPELLCCFHEGKISRNIPGRETISELIVPATVTEIGDQSLTDWSSLSRITFANESRLKRIGNEALSGRSLREINIPATVEEIGAKCFCGCPDLSRVTFEWGSNLKLIGEQAFMDCGMLREIEIPASVEEIGDRCFFASNAREFSLSHIILPRESCLKRIGKEAFANCTNLDEVEIPASVEEIGDGCFKYTELVAKMSSPYGPRNITFARGSALKRIGTMAFLYCNRLQRIEIPAGVEEISECCFGGCEDLSSITFATGSILKRIKNAFPGCSKLESIEIPATVNEISGGLLKTQDISKVSFSGYNNFFTISSPFIICNTSMHIVCLSQSVLDIRIPAEVTELGDGCFSNSSVARVTFTNGCVINRIGKEAFIKCIRLEEIEIPASVEEIGDVCFYECSSLARVTFGNLTPIKRIGIGVFGGCKRLERIQIPASVQEIGDACFEDCSSLHHINFERGSVLKRIGTSAFSLNTMLTEIELPASVEEIGEECFQLCANLRSITSAKGKLPKTIGKNAFQGCDRLVLRETKLIRNWEHIGLERPKKNNQFDRLAMMADVLNDFG